MIFFLLLIILIGVVVYFFLSNSQSSYDHRAYTREDDFKPASKSRPKISAELNEDLYSEVRTYCSNHSMTVSDLIRKSVKAYIDSN